MSFLPRIREDVLQFIKQVNCHFEPFTFCHSERSEESIRSAQDKLREESISVNEIKERFFGISLRMTIVGQPTEYGSRNPETEPLDSRLDGNEEIKLCIDLFWTLH